MADVYHCEVSWDGVVHTGPAPSATQSGGPVALRFHIEDHSAANFGHTIEVKRVRHSYGAGPTYEWRTEITVSQGALSSNLTAPPVAVVYITRLEADGQNGAAFLAGGRLLFTKDEISQTITVDTPLGSNTVTFAAAATANGSLRGRSLYHSWSRPDANADGSTEVSWFDFWTDKNGVRTSGAQLGATQPGVWLPTTTTYYGNGANIHTFNTITENRRVTGFDYVDATDNPRNPFIEEWNIWNGGDGIADIPLYLDATRSPEDGFLWYVRVTKQHPERVRIGRSEDGGASWLETTVWAAAGAFNSTPTITWTAGQLLVMWRDGASVRLARSENQGQSFGTAALVPSLTATFADSLQHAADRESGTNCVLYRLNALGVTAVRSETTMVPFAPLTGEATAFVLQVPAPAAYLSVEPLEEGEFGAVWCHDGRKMYQRTEDYGHSWMMMADNLSTECHPTNRWRDGIVYHLFWENASGGRLGHYLSEGFVLTVLTGSGGTIATGVAEQRADFEFAPDGSERVIYQVYNAGLDTWDIATKASQDFGRSWF